MVIYGFTRDIIIVLFKYNFCADFGFFYIGFLADGRNSDSERVHTERIFDIFLRHFYIILLQFYIVCFILLRVQISRIRTDAVTR